jgi:hypothetical protein
MATWWHGTAPTGCGEWLREASSRHSVLVKALRAGSRALGLCTCKPGTLKHSELTWLPMQLLRREKVLSYLGFPFVMLFQRWDDCVLRLFA